MRTLLLCFGVFVYCNVLFAKVDKVRCMVGKNSAVEMTLGWNQVSGSGAVVYYDMYDYGTDYGRYSYQVDSEAPVMYGGMRNVFVQIGGLKPNTVYYFVLKDSDGVSRRMSFKTLPNAPAQRLSLVTMDTEGMEASAVQDAHKLLAKLRPHAVLLGGDLVDDDTDAAWQGWLDSWSLSAGKDGRLVPIVAMGGERATQDVSYLSSLFGVDTKDGYLSYSLGDKSVHICSVLGLMWNGGVLDSLSNDLARYKDFSWKFVQGFWSDAEQDTVSKVLEAGEVDMAFVGGGQVSMGVSHPVKWTGKGIFERDSERGVVYVGSSTVNWGAELLSMVANNIATVGWMTLSTHTASVRVAEVRDVDGIENLDDLRQFEVPSGLKVLQTAEMTDNVYVRSKQRVRIDSVKEPTQATAPVSQQQVAASANPSDWEGTDGLSKNRLLPTLLEFTGEVYNKTVTLNWTMRYEQKRSWFYILRSIDDGKFVVVDSLRGVNSDKTEGLYKWTDRTLSGKPVQKVGYKVRLVNGDKSGIHSVSTYFNFNLDEAVPTIYSSPNIHKVEVEFILPQADTDMQIHVLNEYGNEVLLQDVGKGLEGENTVWLNTRSLKKGAYILHIFGKNTRIAQRLLLNP
jgi:hypothetical protein